MRTTDTGGENGRGMIMLTFTPLSGLTPVVLMFLPSGKMPDDPDEDRFVVMAGWDDVPHIPEDEKKALLRATPPHLRKARSKGVPQIGAGAIYPIEEEEITVKPFEIPAHWPRAYALDVGWKKTAVLWGAYDREADCWYIYSEYGKGEEKPAVHSAAIKGRGDWVEGVIDPAARGRGQKDGEKLIEIYEETGLHLSTANNAVEAGLLEVFMRLSEGRLKIFSTCVGFFAEYRIYRRDDKGKVVKDFDHFQDCCRYLILSGKDVMKCRVEKKESWKKRLDQFSKTSKPKGAMVA